MHSLRRRWPRARGDPSAPLSRRQLWRALRGRAPSSAEGSRAASDPPGAAEGRGAPAQRGAPAAGRGPAAGLLGPLAGQPALGSCAPRCDSKRVRKARVRRLAAVPSVPVRSEQDSSSASPRAWYIWDKRSHVPHRPLSGRDSSCCWVSYSFFPYPCRACAASGSGHRSKKLDLPLTLPLAHAPLPPPACAGVGVGVDAEHRRRRRRRRRIALLEGTCPPQS
ncbi:unnamed protein product [Prorocentrum cordatum]|uniref:Uncharacterized protein n=1 Tax=Prorocentrum cordatum TaxID=2364126 RepID=A0ABN9UUQ2_9DINO|nr:unnamed protein product [Polarella glacialis]